jgi:hypothetical protein
MQGGGNRKILGEETALGSAQGGGMIRGTGAGIQSGAALGRRQQGLDKAAAAFEMASGRRMAGQDMREEIKDIYEDETRLSRAIQGGLQLAGQGGAHYLSMKKLKEIADQKKLQEMMQPDEASEYAASEIDSLLEDQALAKRLQEFAPEEGVNPAYDALPLEGKIAIQALTKQRDQALAGAIPPAGPLTREQQIANIRAMEPVAEPVVAPSVDGPEPTPIRQILPDEEEAVLSSLLERMVNPNAAYSATRQGLMDTFLQQRRAKALAEAEARIAAAIENNDVLAFNDATKARNDILRGDF